MRFFLFFIMILPCIGFAENIQEALLNGNLAIETEPVEVAKITYDTYRSEGKPWMILVHGLGGSRASWSPVIAELSKNFQLLVYDQRGHGDNGIDKDNYSSSTMARDLAVLMDSLNIEKAHLVGHSMGGRTVIRFAAAYPDRALTITVEDMHAIGRNKLLRDMTELAHKIRPIYKPAFDSLDDFYNQYQPFMQWQKKSHASFFGYQDYKLGKFILRFKPHANLLYSNQALQEDLTSALISIKAPITFFAAGDTEEAVLFGKGIEHIRENKPEAKIIVFDGMGHSIHWQDTPSFLRELRKSTTLAPIRINARSCSQIF